MSTLHDLTVARVDRITPDAVAVAFELPEALAERFAFAPGQYLTLETELDGQKVRRSYSICSGPQDPLRVGIKKVEGGRFSTFAHERLEPGRTLRVMPPMGRFVVLDEPRPLHHVAFAAGSGITPILAIAGHVLERRPDDRFTLFYGNRRMADVMFLEELHRLKDRYMGRLVLHHFLSRESSDVPFSRGRLDGAKIRALADARVVEPSDLDVAYVCGPGDMIDAVTEGLLEVGVPRDRVRFERFTPAGEPAPARVEASPAPAPSGAAEVEVEVRLDGVVRSFPLTGDEGVIEAASKAGVDVPWSCHGGMCSTCRCKLVEGEATMAVNYALEPWELERGYILACQARPKSARLVLDFDDQ